MLLEQYAFQIWSWSIFDLEYFFKIIMAYSIVISMYGHVQAKIVKKVPRKVCLVMFEWLTVFYEMKRNETVSHF